MRERSSARHEMARIIERNRAESLGAYFRSLARASITASAILGSACTTSHTQGLSDGGNEPNDTGNHTPPICDEGRWRPLSGLDLAQDYDYLAIYSGICGGCAPWATVIASEGEVCRGASDPAACQREVEFSSTLPARHVVTTHGGAVARFSGPSGIAALLGPINTPHEALLRLWHQGYDVECGEPGRTVVRDIAEGYEVTTTFQISDCPITYELRRVRVTPAGEITVLESQVLPSGGGCVGRRPPGLREIDQPRGDDLGFFLADVARLEASAVIAFDRLAEELEALGAPRDLIDEVRGASADEVRHATMMSEVARERGVEVRAPEIEHRPLRGLFELALDNAVEGCVRETFGALVGHHQAEGASDARLRGVFAIVADDETRHASISWRIAQWIEPQLGELERTQLRQAQVRAIVALRAEMSVTRSRTIHQAAGFPRPQSARALIEALEQSIWLA